MLAWSVLLVFEIDGLTTVNNRNLVWFLWHGLPAEALSWCRLKKIQPQNRGLVRSLHGDLVIRLLSFLDDRHGALEAAIHLPGSVLFTSFRTIIILLLIHNFGHVTVSERAYIFKLWRRAIVGYRTLVTLLLVAITRLICIPLLPLGFPLLFLLR